MDLLNPHSSKDVVTQRPGINLLFMATFEKNLASDIWNDMKVTSAGAHSTISTMHFCLDNLWKNQGDCKIRCMLYAMSSNHGKEWRRTRVDRQWLKIGQIDTFFPPKPKKEEKSRCEVRHLERCFFKPVVEVHRISYAHQYLTLHTDNNSSYAFPSHDFFFAGFFKLAW